MNINKITDWSRGSQIYFSYRHFSHKKLLSVPWKFTFFKRTKKKTRSKVKIKYVKLKLQCMLDFRQCTTRLIRPVGMLQLAFVCLFVKYRITHWDLCNITNGTWTNGFKNCFDLPCSFTTFCFIKHCRFIGILRLFRFLNRFSIHDGAIFWDALESSRC